MADTEDDEDYSASERTAPDPTLAEEYEAAARKVIEHEARKAKLAASKVVIPPPAVETAKPKAGLDGVAMLALCSLPCVLALVPIYRRSQDKLYIALCVAQAAVLVLSASGLLVIH